ncbi:MAG: CBS domain-containing protein [Lentimicrobium sp.]|jgi:CBS domain-containing protein|nr:CBS domain-containing protein [Lentimicrobium sp.]MDD2529365.1 CBS domain-containing protein [Lentimicrobiaceae bacterium]MDD4598212.1 CBS domain-containing protein [Lentimicrobiaceae bacterium]MDY0026220.1 CBS domain-containing protein [Lentimicrobium sp.]
MLARSLISDLIVPLRTSDTGLQALNLMEEFKVSHLPIVNNNDLLGLVTETDIFETNTFEEPLGNHNLSLIKPYVYDYQHVYDVIRIVYEQKLTLIPVVDEKHTYLGSITLNCLVKYFARLAAVDNPGGIIVLEMGIRDYSLSEIARHVESNDANILSLYIVTLPDSTRMEVTIKIDRMDIAGIIQTFNRFNYTIKASFFEDDFDDTLRDRYDSFMRFLNT